MEGLDWQAARRMERICVGHGLDPDEVGRNVHLWHRPPLRLIDQDAVDGLGGWVAELEIAVLILDNYGLASIGGH